MLQSSRMLNNASKAYYGTGLKKDAAAHVYPIRPEATASLRIIRNYKFDTRCKRGAQDIFRSPDLLTTRSKLELYKIP